LQDISDAIPQGTFPRLDIPILELAGTVEHDDVQKSLEAATLPVTSNEDVHLVPTVFVPPFFTIDHVDVHDDVDNNVSPNREGIPISAPKGANDSIPLDLAAVHMPSQDMRPPSVDVSCVVAHESSAASFEHLIGRSVAPQDAICVQHVNLRLQHDLELWQRIKEYDKKAAEEPFFAVLTKKQKQMMRKELLDGKPPYSTRSRGPSPTPQ
jgi:hypothetical protein